MSRKTEKLPKAERESNRRLIKAAQDLYRAGIIGPLAR